MTQLSSEIEANFEGFCAQWTAEQNEVLQELSKSKRRYLRSYTRLVSLNAWRENLLSNLLSPVSLAFFLEAQNDALLSHVLASIGCWRSALKSLRSCIENTLSCLYYKDHPVELELWQRGSHRMEFIELHKYLSRHPAISSVTASLTGLDLIKREYSTLSRAVHAFAPFRMTAGQESTSLWSASRASLGAWQTRESNVIRGLNLLLVTLFREHLQGARLPGLRAVVALAITGNIRQRIGEDLKVNLH